MVIMMISGCASHDYNEKVEEQNIIAWGKSSDQFYVMTEQNDFVFPIAEFKELEKFLQSSFAKKITSNSVRIKVKANEVSGTLHLGIGVTQKLNSVQIKQLIEQYKFKQDHPYQLSEITGEYERMDDQFIYSRDYWFSNGQRVLQLQDRHKVIKQVTLKDPIPTQVAYIKQTKSIDTKAIEAPVWIIVMVPLLPLVAISN